MRSSPVPQRGGFVLGFAFFRKPGSHCKSDCSIQENFGRWESPRILSRSVLSKEEGVDYVPSPTLRNIEKHRKDFTVFSHLDHDVGGRSWRGKCISFCGVRKQESRVSEKKRFLGSDCGRTCESASAFRPLRQESGEGTDMCLDNAPVFAFSRQQSVPFVQRSVYSVATVCA